MDFNFLGIDTGTLGSIFFRAGSDAMQVGVGATFLWFFKAASASRAANQNYSIRSVLRNEGGYLPNGNYFGAHRHQAMNVFSQMAGNALWYYLFTGIYKEQGGTSASTEAMLAVTGGTLGAMPGTFAMSRKASDAPQTIFKFTQSYLKGAIAPCGGKYSMMRVWLGALCEASREGFYFGFAIPSQKLSRRYFGDGRDDSDSSSSCTPKFVLGSAVFAALGGILSGPGNAMSTVFYKSASTPSLKISEAMPSLPNMALSCGLRGLGMFGTFGLVATVTALTNNVRSLA